MATPVKTLGTSLLSLQNIPASGNVVGGAIDVTTKFSGTVWIHFGRKSSTAYTVLPNFRIEGNAKGSSLGFWFPLAGPLSPTLGTSLIALGTNGTVNAGQNVVTFASTANILVGDVLYFNNTVPANSEFGRVKVVTSNVSVTLEENLQNAQTSSTAYKAEMFAAQLDLSNVTNIRLVADNSGNATAGGFDIEAFLSTLDSIG